MTKYRDASLLLQMISGVVFLFLYPSQGSFLKILEILGNITWMQIENLWQSLCFYVFFFLLFSFSNYFLTRPTVSVFTCSFCEYLSNTLLTHFPNTDHDVMVLSLSSLSFFFFFLFS